MKKPEVSIIILSWNTKALLRDCLNSLLSTINNPDLVSTKSRTGQQSAIEIIVIDNGSTDGSVEYLRDLERKKFRTREKKKTSQFLNVHNYSKRIIEANEVPKYNSISLKTILNRTNLGFAAGNNQGIKEARGEMIMFLNSDTIVQEDAIETLFKYLKGKKKVGGVSPLLLNEDGSIQKDPCYLKFPSPLMTLFYYNRLLKKIAVSLFPRVLFSAIDFGQPVAVDQLPGAALMVKKELLQEIGGFNEDYQLYFEDTDLSWRLRKKGYQLMVVPQAKIIHLGRKSIEPVIKKRGIERFYFLNFSSLFLFCEKNYSDLTTWLIKIVVFGHLFLTLKFGLIKKLIKR